MVVRSKVSTLPQILPRPPMPVPNPHAQELSQQLVYALNKLLSNYSQNPVAREVLQLDRPSPNRPNKRDLLWNLSQIGRGTHNPNEVDEIRVVHDASQLEEEAHDLCNLLKASYEPAMTNQREKTTN